MAQIKILSFQEAQKIAAGEVVERPASVVKELLENAVDAGATHITLAIQDGGKKLIRVTDNGCGMSLEDARLCIAKHATSKINCIDDLTTIGTFGFRGEALAALAAVSRMTIITKQEHTNQGVKLTVENGKIKNEEPVAAQTGTTIEIVDLFYNVPARQKFLKKRETEFRHIQNLFNALCLAHPYIHGEFFSESMSLAQYHPADTMLTRCSRILKPAAHHKLLECNTTEKDITIHAVISDHQWFRYDRSGIYVFVNKRWVKNQHIARAILRGYTNVMPQGKFPVACIMLTVNTDTVDVNVHPRKEEVQFAHPRRIENVVRDAIKCTLEDNLSALVKPATTLDMPNELFNTQPFANEKPSLNPTSLFSFLPWKKPEQFTQGPTHSQLSTQSIINTKDITTPSSQSMSESTQNKNTKKEAFQFTLLGQLLTTYILAQTEEGLLLVDQHAAHERIMYELFAVRFESIATVQLLFPEIITLTKQDWQTLKPHLSLLQKNGIAIEPFGDTQLRVTATPVHLKNSSIEELVHYLIGLLHEHETVDTSDVKEKINKKLHAQMACKAAVKAGDILDEQQMIDMLRDLHTTNNRLTCPHGRPTCWVLSQYEIEKKFKRVG